MDGKTSFSTELGPGGVCMSRSHSVLKDSKTVAETSAPAAVPQVAFH